MVCCKKIIIIILLFLIVFNTFSFAAVDTSYTNTHESNYMLLSFYDNLLNSLVNVYNRYYGNNDTVTTYFNNIFNSIKYGYFIYLEYGGSNNINTNYYYIFYYNYNDSFTVVDDSAFKIHDDTYVPSALVNINIHKSHWVNMGNNTMDIATGDYQAFIPLLLFRRIPTQFIDLMERSGYSYSGDTALLMDIKEELSQLNETINDDTVNSTSSDIPSYSYTNPAEDGVNNLFTNISSYMTKTNREGSGINLPIPFVNKNIFIPTNLTQNIVNSIGNVNADMTLPNGYVVNINFSGFISALISAFWWYIISRYIILDILDKTYKIQTGDIENLENENIKGDML